MQCIDLEHPIVRAAWACSGTSGWSSFEVGGISVVLSWYRIASRTISSHCAQKVHECPSICQVVEGGDAPRRPERVDPRYESGLLSSRHLGSAYVWSRHSIVAD